MEYTPEYIRRAKIEEKLPQDLSTVTEAVLVRKLRVIDRSFSDDKRTFFITVDNLCYPLKIAADAMMTFGTESVTSVEYFRRVIERNDLIDVIVEPAQNGLYPITLYWIHINYVGSLSETGKFSKKDDGLFAMRTKAGEKAERIATRHLINEYNHVFHDALHISPGFFEIRYKGKRHRKPDRKCLSCRITFEVKKRNKDRHLRVSHSEARPFSSENTVDGWHVFVFPDMKPRYLANSTINDAISQGRYKQGRDRYDSWVDVDHLQPTTPIKCSTNNQA